MIIVMLQVILLITKNYTLNEIRFIKELVGEYLVLDIIKDMEIMVIVSWTYWKKKSSLISSLEGVT